MMRRFFKDHNRTPFKPHVQHVNQRHQWFRRIGLSVLIALIIAASFAMGQHEQSAAYRHLKGENAQLSMRLSAQEEALVELETKFSKAALSVQVSEGSVEDTRQDIKGLQEQVSELEQLVGYYRSLMDSSNTGAGVSLGKVDIVKQLDQQWNVEGVVQQVATRHKVIKGTLRMSVIGVEDGKKRIIDLPEKKLSFRYFQRIHQNLALPETFVPARLELTTKVEGKRAKKSSINWPKPSTGEHFETQ